MDCDESQGSVEAEFATVGPLMRAQHPDYRVTPQLWDSEQRTPLSQALTPHPQKLRKTKQI